MGTDWGLTVQQRLADKVTFEGILQNSFQREEVILTGLIERHYPILVKNLNVYAGAGLHKGWNSTTVAEDEPAIVDPFGINLIGGAEFTIGRFNLSYDFKPVINITGGEENLYFQSGFSVRYVLLKNKVYKDLSKDKKKKQKQKAKAKKKKQKQKAKSKKNGNSGLFGNRGN